MKKLVSLRRHYTISYLKSSTTLNLPQRTNVCFGKPHLTICWKPFVWLHSKRSHVQMRQKEKSRMRCGGQLSLVQFDTWPSTPAVLWDQMRDNHFKVSKVRFVLCRLKGWNNIIYGRKYPGYCNLFTFRIIYLFSLIVAKYMLEYGGLGVSDMIVFVSLIRFVLT